MAVSLCHHEKDLFDRTHYLYQHLEQWRSPSNSVKKVNYRFTHVSWSHFEKTADSKVLNSVNQTIISTSYLDVSSQWSKFYIFMNSDVDQKPLLQNWDFQAEIFSLPQGQAKHLFMFYGQTRQRLSCLAITVVMVGGFNTHDNISVGV